jgi:hypothetical protein
LFVRAFPQAKTSIGWVFDVVDNHQLQLGCRESGLIYYCFGTGIIWLKNQTKVAGFMCFENLNWNHSNFIL